MKAYIISLSFVIVIVLLAAHVTFDHKKAELPAVIWQVDAASRLNAIYDAGGYRAYSLQIDTGRTVEFGFREDGVVVWRDIRKEL